jgi:hypothetical protein
MSETAPPGQGRRRENRKGAYRGGGGGTGAPGA